MCMEKSKTLLFRLSVESDLSYCLMLAPISFSLLSSGSFWRSCLLLLKDKLEKRGALPDIVLRVMIAHPFESDSHPNASPIHNAISPIPVHAMDAG